MPAATRAPGTRERLDPEPSTTPAPASASPALPDLRVALLGEPAWIPLRRASIYMGVRPKRASAWLRTGELGPEGLGWRKVGKAHNAAVVVHRDALLRFCRWDRRSAS
jgi:hypothetical protein